MSAVAVAFEGVTKRFDGRSVLDDVSFEVPAGRAFCILGRSGTGKSVTLKHIVGLMQPDAGRVVVLGRDMRALRSAALAEVRRQVGFLFQDAALFDSMTVAENVAFPLRRHRRLGETDVRARVQAGLDAVGLGDRLEAMPAELSGGMRKRAGLARAMALDPPVLLVDEPSAGLDPITSAEIDALLLAQKRAGTTLVIVTHNMPSARLLGDTLLVLADGRIAAQGSAAELSTGANPLVRQFLAAEGTG